MAPTTGAARRALTVTALAGAVLFVSARAFAAAPSLTPKVLQCDGTYLAGSVTSHPSPSFTVDELDSVRGLKIGQRRLSVIPNSTKALWRFDGNFTVTVSSCYTGGCSGGDSCKTWSWTYDDANLSPSLLTGQCTYRDTLGTTCADTMALYALATNQAIVPTGAACTASTTTLPSASGTTAITPLGPLAGTAANALSAEALQLNGTSLHASAADSTAWDLPGSYTLTAWINASAANGRIVSQQGATGYWGIGVGATGGLRHFDSREASGKTDVTSSGNLVGGWHLVHLVRRNAIDRRYYIDGVLVSTEVASSTNSFSTHPNAATLEIGRYNSGGAGSEFFNGRIDDVRILNTTLSDDDIRLEWNTQMHKYSANGGVTFSTAAGSYSGTPSNGTTSAVSYSTAGASPAEPYSASARWVFTAQNIDGESALSSIYSISIDNSAPVAPAITGVATSTNDITWSWGLPPRVCLPPGSATVSYGLVDATGGGTINTVAHPTLASGDHVTSGPNKLLGRKLRVTDTWGSALGLATSIYTLANPPLANSVVPTFVSTGGALITWNQNGNPSYTRYLVSFSSDSLFATGVSTPVSYASSYTGSSVSLSDLSAGSTYFARVQAFSGRSTDTFGGVSTVFVSTSFTTLPATPLVTGVPFSFSAITWTWSSVTGAQYYKLFDVAGSTLYTGGNLSFLQTSLSTNTQYSVQIEAISNNGPSARSNATTFTKAADPTSPLVYAAHSSSATYIWNGNTNPSYTFYELTVTTDVTFGIVVTTLTVNATTATVTGLFPGTTYYARLRSINGNQSFGTPVPIASTMTIGNPAITTVSAPPSAYVPTSSAVGDWHFDESTGVFASDSASPANTAYLTCLTAACVSTPTFVAGPSGLGTAVSFSGLDNGLVRAPDTANYAFTDSLTLSAWVKPSSLSQPNGAGLIVRGSGTLENFALEIFGGLYRFAPTPAKTVSSTNSITVGTWTHLIGVYDSAAGTATLYVNGQAASTVTGVPARTAANHDITIGNRQSGSTSYDRGFLGSIDSVRVQHLALNAAQALSEYQGSFISTITPPSPNDGILIGLAPNAFGAPATLFVSADPLTNPIRITPAVLNAGLTVIPTGFTLVPNSIIEVVPIVGGTPFTQTLGSEASISMPYSDANGNNIIDNTNPPLAASAIKVYTLNTAVNRWEVLTTYIDPATRRVTVFTPHFSVFAMFAPLTVGTALSQVRVYPIPWRPGSLSRFDAPGITFDFLPVSGSIRILNLAGERIQDIAYTGASSGSLVWDGLTDGGLRAASGVYFARITGEDGATALVKFAIER